MARKDYTFNLDEELVDKLSEIAEKENATAQSMINRLIKKYLEDHLDFEPLDIYHQEYVYKPYEEWDKENYGNRVDLAKALLGQIIFEMAVDTAILENAKNAMTKRERYHIIRGIEQAFGFFFQLVDGVSGPDLEKIFGDRGGDLNVQVALKLEILDGSDIIEEFSFGPSHEECDLVYYFHDWKERDFKIDEF